VPACRPAAPALTARRGAILRNDQEFSAMGKGDSRTRKGKISTGSYGNARPHTAVIANKPAAAAPAKKAPAKKAPAKKA
jgi:30S ribosomal protein S31